MSKDTVIILVHGFWGGAAHWSKVIQALDHQGYRNVRAIELSLMSFGEDVSRLQKMIRQQKGEVLLVGHSYGGAVITEAGNLPNVAGLVYIAAFAPDTGESPGALTAQMPPDAYSSIAPDSDGYLWIQYEQYHKSFCQDLSEAEAWTMSVTQKAPLGATFAGTITAPAWKVKPSWYQISGNDRMIHPENQKMMSARISPRQIITLETGHASLASQPVAVTQLIIAAAESVS